MTAHFTPSSGSPVNPLRVVPPTELAPAVPGFKEPAVADSHPNTTAAPPPAHSKHSRRWLIWGAIACSIGMASFIPTPYQVGGSVQLDWRETARQSVHLPIPATVTEIKVKTGDVVQPGQVLAHLSSRELDRELAEVEEKLVRARQERASAQVEQVRAQANLLESRAQERSARARSARLQQRVEQMRQGNLPAEVRPLQVEQRRLQGQLQEAQVQVERHEELYRQGAISKSALEAQQATYRNLERDLAAKGAQIELAQRQILDGAQDEMTAVNQQTASVEAAAMVARASEQMKEHQGAIAPLEQRLQQLTELKAQMTVRATTGGTVITSDLDLLVGQELKPEIPLLRIADLTQLTANVEVPEEDLDYVVVGAPVTFRPRQAKLNSYDAHVEDILHNVQLDSTQQRRVATVRVVINNSDGRLRPGSGGYARIFSEWIPLYERVGREILKLVPERFL